MIKCALVAVWLMLVAGAARAEEIAVASLGELRAAALKARAGDRLVLKAGVHEGSLHLEGLRGEEGKPIVIAGEVRAGEEHQDRRRVADPDGTGGGTGSGTGGGTGSGTGSGTTIRGGVQLSRSSWVVIEDLVVEGSAGNGINVDDGGDRGNPARGVVVRRVVVRDVGRKAGRNANLDGIKLSGLVGFRVEDCVIERWGGGGSGIDMVGCREGVIEGCVLRGGGEGAGVGSGASGIQMKGGSREVVVRGCRLEHAGGRAVNIGGSTGLEFFRPPLDEAGAGVGKGERFEAAGITVERCVIIGSDAAVAFVGVDGAEVRFNTIHHPRRWVVRILQETREPGFVACRGGKFTDNLIVFDVVGAGRVNVGDATEPGTFVFARNWWYCDAEPGRSKPALPTPEEKGVYGVDPGLKDAAGGDFGTEKELKVGAEGK